MTQGSEHRIRERLLQHSAGTKMSLVRRSTGKQDNTLANRHLLKVLRKITKLLQKNKQQ